MNVTLRRPQSSLPAFAVLAAGALLVVAIVTATILAQVLRGEVLSDWFSFYTAGTLVRDGAASEMYDASVQAATQRRLFGEDVVPMGYPLPAFASFLFAPFTLLSFRESYLAWLSVNIVLLAALLRLGWSWLCEVPSNLRGAFLACSAALAVPTTLLAGQVDLLVLAGFAGCYALLRANRPFTGGALLAIALIKPHLAIAVALLLLVKQQWRAIAGLAAAGVPLLVVPLLLAGPRLFADQIGLLLSYTNTATEHRVNAASMINVRGPITGLTGSTEPWLWLPVLAVVAAVALFVALRVWRDLPALHPQSWALAFVLPLLYSPHVHVQTLVLLIGSVGLYVAADSARAKPVIDVQHIFAAFVAVTMLWLFGVAGIALMAFPILAVFTLFARRWPAAAAQPVSLLTRRALALAS